MSKSVSPAGPSAILVVEDDPDFQKIVVRQLKRKGFTVYTANDGQEALTLLDSNDDIGVILSDVRMPRLSGIEMLKILNEKGRINPPSLIFLTGFSEATEREVLELGAKSVLLKPCSFDRIIQAVQSAMA